MLLPSHFMAICHFFKKYYHKANLKDLVAATGLVILFKLDWNHQLISQCDLETWWMTSKNNKALPLYLHQTLCIISNPLVYSNWSYSPEMLNSGKNWRFFVPRDLEIWWMTLNKANLRDLIAATGLVILLKLDSNRRFFSPCDLEIWRITLKNQQGTSSMLLQALCSIL